MYKQKLSGPSTMFIWYCTFQLWISIYFSLVSPVSLLRLRSCASDLLTAAPRLCDGWCETLARESALPASGCGSWFSLFHTSEGWDWAECLVSSFGLRPGQRGIVADCGPCAPQAAGLPLTSRRWGNRLHLSAAGWGGSSPLWALPTGVGTCRFWV